MTAVEVSGDDKITRGMVELNIPAQTYAKFLYCCHVVDYMATYRKIGNNWTPESKIEVSDGP
ncbi:MAG: GyrI-like domain-containing protein [Bdellovibrionales bacterium]|nr:GyrI-like domain-containing protein [Bdellovibrionales bacterium]